MANIKDFAVGLVLTAPSPATTGTTLTLRAGEGATMPNPPFYVTATPPGQLTTLGTSEKLLVTAVASDTLTIVRAQGSTTAKSIAANWIIANALYVDDVIAAGVTLGGAFTGTVNGTNPTFTLPIPATAVTVYKNGVRMRSGTGNDYVFTNNNTVTFEAGAIPATGSVLTYDAIIGSTANINGTNSWMPEETPTGTVNGTNKVFTVSRPYIGGTLRVYVNGLRQALTTHFTETSSTTFTLDDAPLTGDVIRVEYQFVLSTSGNADTVDSYHADATPTANTIPVLDSNARMPTATLGGAWSTWTPTLTPSSGAFSNVNSSGRYTQVGKTVHFSLKINIINIGTASGCNYTLPVTALNNPASDTVAYGREDAVTGKMLQSKLLNGTSAGIAVYDNTSAPIGNGYVLNLKGTYEAA